MLFVYLLHDFFLLLFLFVLLVPYTTVPEPPLAFTKRRLCVLKRALSLSRFHYVGVHALQEVTASHTAHAFPRATSSEDNRMHFRFLVRLFLPTKRFRKHGYISRGK